MVKNFVELNLSNMAVEDSIHTSFSFSIIEGQGISFTLGGLGGTFAYCVIFYVEGIGISGDFCGKALFNESTFSSNIIFTADSQGNPKIEFDSVVVDIRNFDPGLTGLIEDVAYVLSPLLEQILDYELSETLPDLINNQIVQYLSTISTKIFLDPKNLSVLDVGLQGNPVFSSGGIIINLKGDAYAVNLRSTCPYNASDLPNIEDKSFKAYISNYIFRCSLLALEESGAANEMVEVLIKQYIHLDERLSIGFNFTEGSYIDLNPPGGISLFISLIFWVDRTMNNVKTPLISIPANISLKLQFKINFGENITTVFQISNINTTFEQPETGPNFPPLFLQQIKNTNFSQLSIQANEFISKIIPEINAKLKTGFPFQSSYIKYFQNLSIELYDFFLFIATDLKGF